MRGLLYQYLSKDHETLDRLLKQATAGPGVIDAECYADFRKRLLRHISIEEKIVLPAIAKWQGELNAPLMTRLHLDHSAIASLMVPTPSPSIVRTLQSVFAVHNPLEEDEGGLYDIFETLAGQETLTLLERLKTAPPVSVLPHNDKPELLDLAKEALARAGHGFKTSED